MGMYDSVIATCPKCGADVEFQSKAGPCELRRYGQASVPPEIARSVSGDVEECECGYLLKLVLVRPIDRVAMGVVDGRTSEEY